MDVSRRQVLRKNPGCRSSVVAMHPPSPIGNYTQSMRVAP